MARGGAPLQPGAAAVSRWMHREVRPGCLRRRWEPWGWRWTREARWPSSRSRCGTRCMRCRWWMDRSAGRRQWIRTRARWRRGRSCSRWAAFRRGRWSCCASRTVGGCPRWCRGRECSIVGGGTERFSAQVMGGKAPRGMVASERLGRLFMASLGPNVGPNTERMEVSPNGGVAVVDPVRGEVVRHRGFGAGVTEGLALDEARGAALRGGRGAGAGAGAGRAAAGGERGRGHARRCCRSCR